LLEQISLKWAFALVAFALLAYRLVLDIRSYPQSSNAPTRHMALVDILSLMAVVLVLAMLLRHLPQVLIL
jgi:hypothetical protein